MSETPKRVAIFSDIHSNLQALEATLKAIENEEVEKLYCCGDLVGYGGNPNECVELVHQLGCPVVAGNHDYAVLGLTDIDYFNEVARAAILWTRQVLTSENSEYLQSLPLTVSASPFYLVHASPLQPEEWNYVLTIGEAKISFEYFEEQFCFIGHSHQPFIVEENHGQLSCPAQPEIELKPEARQLVNVGSVGQPRDTDPRACYCILDFEKELLQIKRVAYNIELAQQAILDNGLPKELAERLAYGW